MAANYVLLETVTAGAAQPSTIVFNNIPQSGYTDLVIKGCTRDTNVNGAIVWQFNADTTAGNYVTKRLQTNGASAYADTTNRYVAQNGTNETANTFTSWEMYIPNYNVATNHTFLIDQVVETNGSSLNNESSSIAASYWTGGAAITSITLNTNLAWAANSTISLYGVAASGTTPVTAPKATGGDIIQTDGSYWYHAFLSSGVFTPSQTLNCQILQIAGGGGGGNGGGAGGAGGLLGYTGQTVTTATAVTVGAGGSANTNGSNSQFASLTASVGGGSSSAANAGNGNTGGSGGGGAGGTSSSFGTGGAGTSGQGNAGGNGRASSNTAGGGGGAGAIGDTATASGGGNGGLGLSTYSSWGLITGTGQNVTGTVYYAGGGGGYGGTHGTGGYGGGGNGGGPGTNGTANTGGGGGGYSGAGGAGIIIVRYAV